MSAIQMKGVIRNGRVEIDEPINLPDGSEVTIISNTYGELDGLPDSDLPMTQEEIARIHAAMDRVEPFDMTDEERAQADAWLKQIND